MVRTNRPSNNARAGRPGGRSRQRDGQGRGGSGRRGKASPSRFPLPQEVSHCLQERPKAPFHLGLWLTRYLAYSVPQGRWERCELTAEAKRRSFLFRDRDTHTPLSTALPVNGPLEAFRRRQEASLKVFQRAGRAVAEWRMRTQQRLVVGLGGESALETSLTLHHVYGFPIVPGSALKGLARTVALFELADRFGVPVLPPDESFNRQGPTPLEIFEKEIVELLDVEEVPPQRLADALSDSLRKLRNDSEVPEEAPIRRLADPEISSDLHNALREFRQVFGNRTAAGGVCFLDAIPAQSNTTALDLDVMNPHYAPYYQNPADNPPADYHDPTPIYFLTVAANSEFCFALVSRRGGEESSRLVEKARELLVRGLKELGVGAKTSAGYGYWQEATPADRK